MMHHRWRAAACNTMSNTLKNTSDRINWRHVCELLAEGVWGKGVIIGWYAYHPIRVVSLAVWVILVLY